ALAAVSVHDEYLRSRLRLACPQPQVVQRVLNKSLTLEIAQRCGIHVPRSYIFSDLAELEAFAPDLQYPVVAKPFHKSKETDFKVRYFHSYDQLHEALAGDPELASRVLLQEFCPGDGVGIEMLIHEGEPVATFQHRRLKELPHTGGAAVVAIAEEPDPELVQQALKLLRAIEWEGVAMVEFRFHRPDRRVALMEINGRYWGTLALPIHAGVDFPLYQWQLLHGEMPVVPRHYAVGLVWRWSAGYIRSWHGRLASTAGRPGLWKGLLPSWRDISPATRDALWMMRDPMPALAEAGRALAGLVKADFTAVIKRLGVGRRKDNGLSVEEGHQKAEVHRS
ncbi:MAG TPA: ATP-grasp domain-containing protein, partial [Terriglobales bacterium]